MRRLVKRELESSIAKDARGKVRDGLLDGPVRGARCTFSGKGPGATQKYDCIAITKRSGSMAEGYEYQATANAKNGEMSCAPSLSPGSRSRRSGAPGATADERGAADATPTGS
jgi:hypothetical protein